MDVTPEFYTWFVHQEIFDLSANMQIKKNLHINIHEKFVEQLLNTEKMHKIVTKIEEKYNKYYNPTPKV